MTEQFGFMAPFMKDVQRGGRQAFTALADLALDYAPETTVDVLGTDQKTLRRAIDRMIDDNRTEAAERGLAGLPFALLGDARTLVPAAKSGPMVGGLIGGTLYGGSEATKEGESRLLNAAMGGASGLALGAAFKAGGAGVDYLSGKAKKVYSALKSTFDDGADELLDSIVVRADGATSVNDMFEKAGKKVIKTYKQGIKSGLTKEQAKLKALADANEIPLSRADLTQDAGDQALQGAARLGMFTDEAKARALGYEDTKSQGLLRYLRGVGKQLTNKDISALDFTSVSNNAANSVYKTVNAAKSNVDDLYAKAREAGKDVKVPAKAVAGLRKEMAKVVDDMQLDVRLQDNEAVRSNLVYLRKMIKDAKKGGIGWREFSNFRKRLSNNAGKPGSAAFTATGKLKRVYDQYLDDLVQREGIVGTPEALTSIRDANSAFKQYKTRFWGKDGKGIAGELFDTINGKSRSVQPEQFVDKVLGGKGAMNNSMVAKRLRELKTALGSDADEIIGDMSGLQLQQLMNSSLADSGKAVNGLTFRNRLEDTLRKNQAGMRELFGDEGLKMLKDAADLTYVATNVAKDKANPSGSGSLLGTAVRTVADFVPGGGPITQVAGAAARSAKGVMTGNKVIKGIDKPLATKAQTTVRDALKNSNNLIGAAAVQGNEVMESEEPSQPSKYDSMTDEEILKLLEGRQGALKERIEVPQSLIEHEGIRNQAYKDTVGKTTVGAGFNMDSGHARKVWQRAGIDADFDAVYQGKASLNDNHIKRLTEESYQIAANDAREFVGNFESLSPRRQEAIVDMSYQLGANNLAEFKGLKSALLNGDYVKAARSILRSRYAEQVPGRARKIATMIMDG